MTKELRDTDYKDGLVSIKGKMYQTVASRQDMALNPTLETKERLKDGAIQESRVEILWRTDQYIAVKATVILTEEYGGKVFEDVAESDRLEKSTEGDSPLETASTSALGRALAKAGIKIPGSTIATSSDRQRGETREQTRATNGGQRAPMPINQRVDQMTGEIVDRVPPPLHENPKNKTEQAMNIVGKKQEEEHIFCEFPGCENKLNGFTDKSGKVYTKQDIADIRKEKYGKVLCTPHTQEAKKTLPQKEKDDYHEEALKALMAVGLPGLAIDHARAYPDEEIKALAEIGNACRAKDARILPGFVQLKDWQEFFRLMGSTVKLSDGMPLDGIRRMATEDFAKLVK